MEPSSKIPAARSGTPAKSGDRPRLTPDGIAKTAPNPPFFGLVRDLLREGREITVQVDGESMLPFFRSGSRIRIHPLHTGDLRPGHVVLGETDSGRFVIHRIIGIGAGYVRLQGDGNLLATETIPCERICGAVTCRPVHLLLARLWRALGPLRRYPLRILKRCSR